MGFLDSLSSIVSPIASIGGLISGLFGESSAQSQENAAINSLETNNANDYQNLVNNNQRTLLQQTGVGGSAITQLGSHIGNAYANAGLYNSSAVAGGLNIAAQNTQSSLADLAARQNFQQQNLLNQQRDQVAQMQYGQAAGNLNYARQQTAGAAGGLQSYLQGITQQNLSNVNKGTSNVGNGTTGNWNLPANVLNNTWTGGDPSGGFLQGTLIPTAPKNTGLWG